MFKLALNTRLMGARSLLKDIGSSHNIVRTDARWVQNNSSGFKSFFNNARSLLRGPHVDFNTNTIYMPRKASSTKGLNLKSKFLGFLHKRRSNNPVFQQLQQSPETVLAHEASHLRGQTATRPFLDRINPLLHPSELRRPKSVKSVFSPPTRTGINRAPRIELTDSPRKLSDHYNAAARNSRKVRGIVLAEENRANRGAISLLKEHNLLNTPQQRSGATQVFKANRQTYQRQYKNTKRTANMMESTAKVLKAFGY